MVQTAGCCIHDFLCKGVPSSRLGITYIGASRRYIDVHLFRTDVETIHTSRLTPTFAFQTSAFFKSDDVLRRVHLDDTSDPVTIRIMHGLGSAVSAQSIRAPTRREDYSCGLYIADETIEDLFVLAASRSVTCYPIELLFPR